MDAIEQRTDWLVKRASEYQGVDTSELYTKSRNHKCVFVRAIVWSNLKQGTNLSLKKLGNIFFRDHSTVLNGLKTYNNLRDTDTKWRDNVDAINRDYLNEFTSLKISHDPFIDDIKIRIFDRTVIASKSNVDVCRILLGI